MKKAKILIVAVIALTVIAPKARALDDLGVWGIGMMVGGGIALGAGAIYTATSTPDDPESIVPSFCYVFGGSCVGLGLIFLLIDVVVSYASADNPDGIYLASAELNARTRNKPVFNFLRHLSVVPLKEKVYIGFSYSY